MNNEPKKIIEQMQKCVHSMPLEFMWEEQDKIYYKIHGSVMLMSFQVLSEELSKINWGGWMSSDNRLVLTNLN